MYRFCNTRLTKPPSDRRLDATTELMPLMRKVGPLFETMPTHNNLGQSIQKLFSGSNFMKKFCLE